jgi:hypothetical protein
MQAEETVRRDAAFNALPYSGLGTEQAVQFVYRWTGHNSRMAIVLSLRRRMEFADLLFLLGRCWPDCDNIREYARDLRQIIGVEGPLLSMMSNEERQAYRALPDKLTVYRGCSSSYPHGASWSLDREVARRFPLMIRYEVADPILITATVRKPHVLALLLGRKEQEIVTFRLRRTKFEPIEVQSRAA